MRHAGPAPLNAVAPTGVLGRVRGRLPCTAAGGKALRTSTAGAIDATPGSIAADVLQDHSGCTGSYESGQKRRQKQCARMVTAKRNMSAVPSPVQAVISDVEGRETPTEDISVLEYNADTAPASGLGLFIGEAHQLLRQLQTVVLSEQVARFMERTSRCRQCGSRLGVKDTKTVVYRKDASAMAVAAKPVRRRDVVPAGADLLARCGSGRP